MEGRKNEGRDGKKVEVEGIEVTAGGKEEERLRKLGLMKEGKMREGKKIETKRNDGGQ